MANYNDLANLIFPFCLNIRVNTVAKYIINPIKYTQKILYITE